MAVEYKVLNRNNLFNKDLEKQLNQLAAEGWRVISASNVNGPLASIIGTIILERDTAQSRRRPLR